MTEKNEKVQGQHDEGMDPKSAAMGIHTYIQQKEGNAKSPIVALHTYIHSKI